MHIYGLFRLSRPDYRRTGRSMQSPSRGLLRGTLALIAVCLLLACQRLHRNKKKKRGGRRKTVKGREERKWKDVSTETKSLRPKHVNMFPSAISVFLCVSTYRHSFYLLIRLVQLGVHTSVSKEWCISPKTLGCGITSSCSRILYLHNATR